MNQNSNAIGVGFCVGAYELLECIGRGGMAEVFLGIKHSVSNIRQFYAIKVIRAHMAADERFRTMLMDEARVMATIHHPNLVHLHEIIEHEGSYFIVMDYLRGFDLHRMEQELRRHAQQLPLPIAVALVRQAALGLHFAHEARSIEGQPLELVHRDISTHNLFLTFDGFVRVLDFGIAQSSMREEVTEHGMIKGKLPYLSLEQCKGEPLDRRTDIYALGVVLYELVTGRRPFSGKNELQLIHAVMNEVPPPPSQLNPSIPPALERLIMTALDRDRTRRFRTAEALADALDHLALQQSWSISARALEVFIQEHFHEHTQAMDFRLSELATLAAQRDRTDSGLLQVEYQVEGEERFTLGRDVQCSMHVLGSCSVFVLEGAIRETFDPEALLSRAQGICVMDLGGIARITSFGIREWLSFLPALRQHTSRVLLNRMSVSFVNQAVAIPLMTEGAELGSLMAPYLCPDCKHSFDHQIKAGESVPFTLECVRCGQGDATLDEDPSYLSILAHAPPLDEALVSILDDILGASGDNSPRIEKHINEQGTEILVYGEVPTQTRWDRYLAGVEGDVRVVFSPGASLPEASLKQLTQRITLAAREANLALWGLPASPESLPPQLAPYTRSVSFASPCPECGADQSREWTCASDHAHAACRQCGAHLEHPTTRGGDDAEQIDPPLPELSTHPSRGARPTQPNTALFVGVVCVLLIAIVAVLSL